MFTIKFISGQKLNCCKRNDFIYSCEPGVNVSAAIKFRAVSLRRNILILESSQIKYNVRRGRRININSFLRKNLNNVVAKLKSK